MKWSTNTAIGDSGHSPSRWVLGRSLRLPFQLLSRASQLASHRDDFSYQRRVAMLAEAQRSIISTRHNKALSRAFLSRARSHRFVLQSETKPCIGVGTTSERVGGRCVGWVQGLPLGKKVLQTCRLVIAMLLSKQLEITFDFGMISTIPIVTQMSRHTLISVRLVRLVIPSMKVHPHRVMLQ